jgi:hypothetical protein
MIRLRIFSAEWKPCTYARPGHLVINDLRRGTKISTSWIGVAQVTDFIEAQGIRLIADGFDDTMGIHYFMTENFDVILKKDEKLAEEIWHKYEAKSLIY